MRTVAELREWLAQFDPASRVSYAHGERDVSLIVIDPNGNYLGTFEASEDAA